MEKGFSRLKVHFQARIQDVFNGGGAPSETKSCGGSEVQSHKQSEHFVASFWIFNAQICILPHSRDSFSLIFDIYFNTKT